MMPPLGVPSLVQPRPPRQPYPNAPPWSPAHQPPEKAPPLPPPVVNPPQQPTVQDLLVGTPVGDVYPRDPSIDGVPVDGRTAALQSLGVYLTSLVYCRPGRLGGPPVYFAIPPENFHVDRPPSEVDLIFPALVALSGPVTARSRGLIPTVDESTRDVYGAGTALIVQEEREETVPLEVWSSTLPELRAILAKLEQAFHPTEERNGFLLRTPAYYWRTARFILEAPEHPDEPMAVQNRFKGVVRSSSPTTSCTSCTSAASARPGRSTRSHRRTPTRVSPPP